MTLSKSVRCRIDMDSAWVKWSGICMGASLFIRVVYYFGLINLRDMTENSALASQVIVPLVLGALYLIGMKAFRFNAPILNGCIIAAIGTSCIFLLDGSSPAIVCIVLLFLCAVLMIVTGIGLIPLSLPVKLIGLTLVLYRMIAMDWQMYIQPLSEFKLVPYLPEASNAFCIVSMGLLCLAVRVVRRKPKPETEVKQ